MVMALLTYHLSSVSNLHLILGLMWAVAWPMALTATKSLALALALALALCINEYVY